MTSAVTGGSATAGTPKNVADLQPRPTDPEPDDFDGYLLQVGQGQELAQRAAKPERTQGKPRRRPLSVLGGVSSCHRDTF